MIKNTLLWSSLILVAFIAPTLVFIARVYATTPLNLRRPQVANHYFRLQIIIDGERVDFSDPRYQDDALAPQCNDALADNPIYISNGLDQFVHIRWSQTRGGDVLKYYGINNFGNQDGFLGYRLDKSLWPEKITTYGDFLPLPPQDAEYWVYTSDPNNILLYNTRTIDEFNLLDLETFLGKESTLTEKILEEEKDDDAGVFSIVGLSQESKISDDLGENEEEEEIVPQDFLGDVVIFIQEDEPDIPQILDRFENVVDLPELMCSN